MRTLKAKDIISGQEGTAYMIMDGRNVELFYAKKVEAKLDKTKATVKTLGHRGTQHKTTGFEITGSMTMFSVTSDFIAMAHKYKETGQDLYFNLKITNEDKTSTIGRQTTILKDCNMNSVMLAQLDVDADFLEQDTDFTVEDFDLLEKFNLPSA